MQQAAKITSSVNQLIWESIVEEARHALSTEPCIGQYLSEMVLEQRDFSMALAKVLAFKIENDVLNKQQLQQLIEEVLASHPHIVSQSLSDLQAFCDRDPACNRYSLPFLYYKGFQGLQLYRIGHGLWNDKREELALFLQSRVSEMFAMDIHPAAKIGKGILIDHATSIVIGETAVVGDNVSMLHEVTLGGTGKDSGDRHPKVSSGVLIGAGAKILGNVHIGKNAKVGAGSVVLDDVDDHCTVAGIPAKPVGECSQETPALEMDHSLESE